MEFQQSGNICTVCNATGDNFFGLKIDAIINFGQKHKMIDH